MKAKIIYPDKPKRNTGSFGGGLTPKTYFPIYKFITKSGYKQVSLEYGKGYLDAIRDIKRLNL